MIFRTLSLISFFFLLNATLLADINHLIPKPQHLNYLNQPVFHLNRNLSLSGDGVDIHAVTQLCALPQFFNKDESKKASLHIEILPSLPKTFDYQLAGFPNESYNLRISKDSIRIQALTETGIIRAAQTLTQLAQNASAIPALEITDYPAFKVRGFMHDVGRSFISVDQLKTQLLLLSHFKVNVFHWHLTENQAWRFEVKKFPQLTADSTMTRLPGRYYTQEQCRNLEKFAAQLGITIIPEVDMPGHSEAFKRAMGFDMQTDEGVQSLKIILQELAESFPLAPYIHIGGDEQTISYPYFLETMAAHLHALNKRVIFWNPIRNVKITPQLGCDMTQMWSTAGKLIPGLPNIDCRYNYINHFDVFADIIGIYNSTIYYEQRGNPEIAGEITALWNDRNLKSEEDIIKQNNFYANVIASAERAWKGGGYNYIEQGGTALFPGTPEFADFADFERRFLFHKANTLKNQPVPYIRQTDLRWKISLPDTSFVVAGAAVHLRHYWHPIVPALVKNPSFSQKATATMFIHSARRQNVHALIEFQNYSRSERDLPPYPNAWDRKGSKIFLNDKEILPPVWENTLESVSNEDFLLNENFTARKPTPISLKKGWNKVEIHLPYEKTEGIRLNKWMFTFVPCTPDGNSALDGLIFSSWLP